MKIFFLLHNINPRFLTDPPVHIPSFIQVSWNLGNFLSGRSVRSFLSKKKANQFLGRQRTFPQTAIKNPAEIPTPRPHLFQVARHPPPIYFLLSIRDRTFALLLSVATLRKRRRKEKDDDLSGKGVLFLKKGKSCTNASSSAALLWFL